MRLNPFSPLHQQFLSGSMTPRAYLETTLAQLEALEPTLHAFVTLCPERARDAADESTRRYATGTPLSILDGCPIGIKDIIETADAPTQMNSPIFQGWLSHRDAPCVHALRNAGGILVGKTHTTEFAIARAAPTTNPHDPSRTPGGSSSGSAAAVGAGLLPLALGTQTVGSILRPASYCGAYGYKPSHGLLPVAGIHPLARSLDTLGTIAASLEDAWAGVYEIWRRFNGDNGRLCLRGEKVPAGRLRIERLAWLATDGWAELDSESQAAFQSLRSKLHLKGVEIVDAQTDPDIAAIEAALQGVGELGTRIICAEMRYPMALYYAHDPRQLSERIREMVKEGEAIAPEERQALFIQQQVLREIINAQADRVDGFITMASTGPAPIGLEYTGDRTFLSPWSVIGAPAFSLPLMTVNNLPVGLQLMGFYGRDTELAAAAKWIEGSALA